MMKEDSLDNFEDLLPKGAVPVCGFRLLSYMTQDGKTHYVFSQVGDVAASQLVGLIEIIKQDITTAALKASRGDDEDDE